MVCLCLFSLHQKPFELLFTIVVLASPQLSIAAVIPFYFAIVIHACVHIHTYMDTDRCFILHIHSPLNKLTMYICISSIATGFYIYFARFNLEIIFAYLLSTLLCFLPSLRILLVGVAETFSEAHAILISFALHFNSL